MTLLSRYRSWLRAIVRRSRMESEMDTELRFHIEAFAEDLVRSGVSRREAQRRARMEFGGFERAKEECRDARGVNWIQDLIQDLRFGLRMLRKSPGFTTVAVLTLALGIGANTAIFSLINAVFLRSLSVPNPQQLVLVEWAARKEPDSVQFARYSSCPVGPPGSSSLVAGCSVSHPMFEEIQSAHDVFSGAFSFAPAMLTLRVNDRLHQLGGTYVSGDFFSTLGSRAAMGRTIEPSDDVAGAAPVIVLSHRFWQTELAADPTIIGATALINGKEFRIVGIAARTFPKLDAGLPEDFWLPLPSQRTVTAGAPDRNDARSLVLEVIARLQPGISIRRAEAELNAIFMRTATSGPAPIFKTEDAPRAMLGSAAQGLASLRARYSKSLSILMTAVGLVLLIACANVAGLMLARSSGRRREMAVRNALGAARSRIMRQLLTESVLVSAAGGALGVVFAVVGAKALATSIAKNWPFPIQFEVTIDWLVLAFTLVVSAAVGILSGLAPALRGSRVDVGPALKLGGQSGATSKQSSRLSNGLVVAQVVISILVLVGAALLGRTLLNLETTDVGFNSSNVLLFQVNMRASGIAAFDDPRLDRYNRTLQERFVALPGVSSASYSIMPLLGGGRFGGDFRVPGAPASSAFTEDVFLVGPGFFETMWIPLLEGRTFTKADFEAPTEPRPIVVNKSFAKKLFGNANPLGRKISQSTGPSQLVQLQVIGVVGDTKAESVRNETRPIAFIPDMYGSPTFELRTQGDPKALVSMVEQAARDVNRDFLVLRVMTQSEQIDRTIYQERLMATLSMLFGLLTLVLACIGLYGLVASGVVRRTHEIGIRRALGAQPHEILWPIARAGLALTLAGVVIGLGVAAGVTRYVASLLYGVRPTDPWTFVGVAILLGTVAGCACYIPARRAMRVDPMVALRYE